MPGTNGTMFTNESSANAGSSEYVQEVFPDVSLIATSNSGLTDSATTNPLGLFMGNSDSMLYGGKMLFIQSLTLLKDRSKWFNNQATYQVTFTEDFPGAKAFIYGDFVTTTKAGRFPTGNAGVQTVVTATTNGNVIGMVVTGIIRRCGFILEGSSAAVQGGTIYADGASDGTVNWSDFVTGSNNTGVPRLMVCMNTTTQTNDLHTYRIEGNTVSQLFLTGIAVYYQNTGSNLEFRPGSTYSDKSKSTTVTGATLALPSYGSSLGGISKYYKTASGVYSATSISCTTVISSGNGTSGAIVVNVTAGHGSSFLPGYGIIFGNGAAGTTSYIGSVVSVSTDALTVSPTLAFGMSGTVYRSWYANATYAINSSLYAVKHVIDLGLITTGFSGTIIDPQGRWMISGYNYGLTTMQSGQTGIAWQAVGTSGAMNIEGNFAAADVEYFSMGATMNHTITVNGCPGYTDLSFVTGAPRRTLVSELGHGWNRVQIAPGISNAAAVCMKRITLFDRQSNIGQTTGLIAEHITQQAYVKTTPTANLACPGTVMRIAGDQIAFRGDWARASGQTYPTGVQYTCGTAAGSSFRYDFIGKDFAILGTAVGGETLTLDSVGQAFSMNSIVSVASEGPHTLTFTPASGTVVQCLDITATTKPVVSLQDTFPEPTDLVTDQV